jgi:hypothetical protein
MTYWEAWVIGTSGPIAADGGGPVERDQIALKLVRAGAERTSSMCIGRGRSICEYDEIMQILPGSSDDAELINALRVICNIAVGVHFDRIETDSRFWFARFLDAKRSPFRLKML